MISNRNNRYKLLIVCFINGEKLMRIQQTLLILLVLSCGFQAALAADEADSVLIFVESTPAYLFKKGKTLKEMEVINKLSAGQSVKLIDDGTVLILSKNKSGKLSRQVDDRKGALEEALAIIAGSRPTRAGEAPPEVWMANVEMRGNYCALKNTITLWRSNAEKIVTLVIKPYKPSGDAIKITWKAGVDKYNFAFQDGAKYRIYFKNNPYRQSSLTFYQIPANIEFIPQRVSWMAKKGCVQQARLCFPYKNECQ